MKKITAFTFIEIMIAIVIFSIWILSVLRLVTSNLSLMDKNNLRTQATLLAKEWIELVYNLRDANVAKELSWNCLMDNEMYLWDTGQLANKINMANIHWDTIESVICDGYFDEDKHLKISFDKEIYVYHNLSTKLDNFDDNYVANKLYLYTWDIWNYPVSWYAYESNWWNEVDTYFARYLSFEKVKENGIELPIDKIMKVTSHVLYNKMWFTGEVAFESFIWNY
jgi:type II secretory pathway pseudopilin PulG